MIQLFTSVACSAECDLRPPAAAADVSCWRRVLPKIPAVQRPGIERDCRGRSGNWWIWRHYLGVWHVSSTLRLSEKHDADVIIGVYDDGRLRVIKSRHGGHSLDAIPDA